MNEIFQFLFSQYSDYATFHIVLEIIGVTFSFLSVWYSKENNILVFPTGMIGTGVFVYLLYKWVLLGDMLINAYYFSVSIYGWYLWTRKTDENKPELAITKTTQKDHLVSAALFAAAIVFIYFVYWYFDYLNSWTAYVDILTTGIFFVGMWLMAKKKIENWIYWIVGDIISIPLYFYKGLTLTSIQYLVLTYIAYKGYLAWKKDLIKIPAV